MARIEGAIVVDTERCKGCSLCIGACPMNCLSLAERKVNHKGYPYVLQTGEGCTGCSSCGIVCPDGCITVYRVRVEQKSTPQGRVLVAAV